MIKTQKPSTMSQWSQFFPKYDIQQVATGQWHLKQHGFGPSNLMLQRHNQQYYSQGAKFLHNILPYLFTWISIHSPKYMSTTGIACKMLNGKYNVVKHCLIYVNCSLHFSLFQGNIIHTVLSHTVIIHIVTDSISTNIKPVLVALTMFYLRYTPGTQHQKFEQPAHIST